LPSQVCHVCAHVQRCCQQCLLFDHGSR
jgi:hypothetical protein